ncbi:hypothetical protein P8936_05535 [Edaphobacter paludis]|uniref:Signal transduction histidine kinase dimerisation/phosphoacceptor domain-containing protein n=1 Tax=Edaphobacter paludis TaxID=3035702 RepID=A0AAU7D1N2_9BACT
MPVPDAGKQLQAGLAARMDDALHELCQPLTVLQCRLAMGELIGGPDAMRNAIAEALVQCTRVNLAVELMRGILQRALQADRDEQERMR